MATLALAAIGGSLLPATGIGLFGAISFGAMAGGIAGSLIDNQLLFPALFSKDVRSARQITGQRLDDFQLQTGSEGSQVNKVYGKRARVAGCVIYLSDLIEEKLVTVTEQESGGGGKGGGGGKVTSETTLVQYFYYFHVAVLACEGEINKFYKVYANGRAVHLEDDATQEVEVTGKDFEVVNTGDMMITNSDNATQGDFRDLKTGVDVVVTGFTNAANNGTFRLKKAWGNGAAGSRMWLDNGSAVAEGEPTVDTVLFAQSIPQNEGADRFAFYTGDGSQSAEAIIQADKGAANTPAWKHDAYMFAEKFCITPYNNQLPQFSFIIEESGVSRRVADTIEAILDNAGFSSANYDTSEVDNVVMRGYAVSGPQSVVAQLEPLLLAFDVHVKEDNGVLYFYNSRALVDYVTDEIGAVWGEGGEPIPTLELSDRGDWQLPSTVIVNYFDWANKYQRGSLSEKNPLVADNEWIDELNLPLVLTPSEARKIARRRLWAPLQERVKGRITLGPRNIHLMEGDKVPVLIDGERFVILVTNLTQGANWIHELTGLVINNREDVFEGEGDPYEGGDPDADPYVPPDVTLLLIDASAILDAHTIVTGYYWALCASQYDAAWQGASVYVSDDDATFSYWDGSGVEASIWAVLTAPGDVTNPWIIDRVNTIVVSPLHEDPVSVTEAEMLAGANRLMVKTVNGWELMAFATATLTDANNNEWTLDTLLRGIGNTEDYTGDHVASPIQSLCVLLNDGGVKFKEHNLGMAGATRYYKPVAQGGDPDDVTSQSFTLGKTCLKPYSPCNVEGAWDEDAGDYDLIVTWTRRTRALTRLFGTDPFPMIEPTEEYELELLDGPSGTVEFTYTGLTSPTKTITDADLTTAGYSPGNDTIYVKVYQISAAVGRGFGREQAITP